MNMPKDSRVSIAQRLRHAGSRSTLVGPETGNGAAATVTVVIPCYNYGRYLPAAVASVTGQQGVSVDIIVVDDASTDASAHIASALAAKDPRIRVIAHERNQGHIATYNDGLNAANGEYCVLMSADDLLAPGALGRATSVMEAEPSVGMVYGTAVPFTDIPPQSSTAVQAWGLWAGADWVDLRCRRAINPIRSPEVVVRTSIQRSAGGYRADLPQTADHEMWMRLASLADVARVVGPDQAYYRVHGKNMHSEMFAAGTGDGMLIDLRNRLLVFEAWQEWMARRGRRCAELVESARRSLARESLVLACRAYRWGHVNDWPVEDLRQFAAQTFADARGLPEWRRLDQYGQIGVRKSRWYPRFVVDNRVDMGQQRFKVVRERWTGV
jgi:hypothetical protein